MKISVIGTGYVGLVVGACFADAGNEVICQDVDECKIAQLDNGSVPIHEPHLPLVIERNAAAGRLGFTTSYRKAVDHADVIFLAVGTPPGEDGAADLRHVLDVAKAVGQHMSRPLMIVNKSTVPVGTADKVKAVIASTLRERGETVAFDVVSNPEFLKEGAALQDFMTPDRIVIGAENRDAFTLMRQLYAPFSRNHEKFVEMDTRSAELTKYAANAMLATRISFMNEMAGLAERLGADIEAVRVGMGTDSRIGPQFLYAGTGYGGSCFPKDVKALIKTAADHGQSLRILCAAEIVNDHQKCVLIDKLARYFDGMANLRGKTIAIWGLAFKPDTDDMREAPSLVLIRALFAAGARVRAYDPAASGEAARILRNEHGKAVCDELLVLASSARQAVEHADALVLMTEWKEFRSPDYQHLAKVLRTKAVFDGRNIYDNKVMNETGLYYEGIGRMSRRLAKA